MWAGGGGDVGMFVYSVEYELWELEGWSNTAARLAGWGRVSQQGVMPPALTDSVVDPGCLSRISDPGSKNRKKRERWKKICCHTFLCSHKFHKIENNFSFEVPKTKIWANFRRVIELFTQKIVSKFSKIWVWDPGSGKNLFRIPDPGVKKAPDPGSGSTTLLTDHTTCPGVELIHY